MKRSLSRSGRIVLATMMLTGACADAGGKNPDEQGIPATPNGPGGASVGGGSTNDMTSSGAGTNAGNPVPAPSDVAPVQGPGPGTSSPEPETTRAPDPALLPSDNGDGGASTEPGPTPESGGSGGSGSGGTPSDPDPESEDPSSNPQEQETDPETPDAGEEPEPAGNDATQLYRKYEDYFTIGAAVDSSSYQDAHAALWREHFNGAVAENEMKWASLQPTEGNFSMSLANSMVNAATSNGMLVRGHVLVWFDQTPDWVFQGSNGGNATKEQLLQRMRTHVTRVMQEFQGRVYAWDVVNEAVVGYDTNNQDVGEDMGSLDHWGYRDSRWHQIAGEDHIFEAFRAARDADPTAKLFYNDFWNYLDGKREFIISFVRRLQEEGLIDGIGLQCHLNISPAQEVLTNQTVYQTVENLEREIQEYAALGLDVHITELDISIYTRDYTSSDQSRWFTGNQLTDELQAQLAARYREFFEMFRRNADLIQNITFWGIADDNTWLSEFTSGRPDHPLLFDKQLQPKEAFHAIMDF